MSEININKIDQTFRHEVYSSGSHFALFFHLLSLKNSEREFKWKRISVSSVSRQLFTRQHAFTLARIECEFPSKLD